MEQKKKIIKNIGIAASVITIMVFLTGKPNLGEWFRSGTTGVSNNTSKPRGSNLKVSYTITFNSMGGSEDVREITYTNEDEILLPKPEKKGYTFAGWFDSENVKWTKISKGNFGNKEFWAKWENPLPPHELKISSKEFSKYNIELPKDGNLTLTFETFAAEIRFTLFDENGISLKPTKKNIDAGNTYDTYFTRMRGDLKGIVVAQPGQECLSLQWNRNATPPKFKGSFIYILDAGSYYLPMIRDEEGRSSVNLSIQFEDLDGNFQPVKFQSRQK